MPEKARISFPEEQADEGQIQVYQRDLGLCRWCLHEGKYTAGAEVHHIVPLAEDFDLRLEKTNLILLCVPCHKMADGGGIPADILRELAQRSEDEDGEL